MSARLSLYSTQCQWNKFVALSSNCYVQNGFALFFLSVYLLLDSCWLQIMFGAHSLNSFLNLKQWQLLFLCCLCVYLRVLSSSFGFLVGCAQNDFFFLVYNKSNNDFFLLLADDGYVYMLVKCECVKDTASDKSKVIHKFECHKYTVFYDIQRLRYTNDWLDALEMCYIFCCVVFLLLGLVGRFGLSRFVRFTVSPVGVQVMKSISNH